MNRRTSQFDTYIDYILFSVLTLFSILLISLNDDNEEMRFLRESYIDISASIQDKFNEAGQYFDLKAENDSLKLEIERLSKDNLTFKSSYFELLELKKNLRLPRYDSIQPIFAEVIGEDFDQVRKQLIINRGRNDSIKINDPVVYQNGLVGKVSQVTDTYSIVKLVTDHTMEISVKILGVGEFGSIRWDAVRYFDLLYIAKNIKVRPGDIIVTSGLSEIYPKGIKVGKVVAIDDQIQGLFKSIKVLPDVNLSRLEYVAILKRKHKSTTDRILFTDE